MDSLLHKYVFLIYSKFGEEMFFSTFFSIEKKTVY